MTQEDKDLLLKDLCARLPYGIKFPITVKNPITSEPVETIGTISDINRYGVVSFVWDYEGQEILEKNTLHIKDIKPFLFPISSMTDEQKEDMIKSSCGIGSDKNVFDWWNKNHFDYRGLIPMGLANDATGKDIY